MLFNCDMRNLFILLVIIFLSDIGWSLELEDKNSLVVKKENDADIFVFPSMQMENLNLDMARSYLASVEVKYRGEPRPPGDDIKSNELDVKKKSKKKGEYVVNGSTITASTWNPDNIDHTVNPNKSRKSKHGVSYDFTTPIPRREVVVKNKITQPTVAPPLLTAIDKRHPTTIDKSSEKTNYKKTTFQPSFDYQAFQEMKNKFEETSESLSNKGKDPLVVSLESIKSYYNPSEVDELIKNSSSDESSEKKSKTNIQIPIRNRLKKVVKKPREPKSTRTDFPHFPTKERSQLPRVSRQFLDKDSTADTKKENKKAYQTITVVHSASIIDDDEQENSITEKEKENETNKKKLTTQKPYLPNVITLHTTAKPGKNKLPSHIKNKDTVILNLPNVKPTDLPEGYELIPLEKLTPEYEVVPWKEAKQVLNVSVAPLGEPKHNPKDNTIHIPQQSHDSINLDDHVRIPRQPDYEKHEAKVPPTPKLPSFTSLLGETNKNVKKHAHYPKEPQSGYNSPYASPSPPTYSAVPHHIPEEHYSPVPQSGYHSTTPPPPVEYSTPVYHETSSIGYGTPQSGYVNHELNKSPFDELYYADLKHIKVEDKKKGFKGEPMSGLAELGDESPWYQPPPISPDLPHNYYDNIPHLKEPIEVFAHNQDVHTSKQPPIVKKLEYHHQHKSNVMHFGSDFGIPSQDFNENIHAPYLKSLNHVNEIRASVTPGPTKVLDTSPLPTQKPDYKSWPIIYTTSAKPDYEKPSIDSIFSHLKISTPAPKPRTIHHGSKHAEKKPNHYTTPKPSTTSSPFPYEHWSTPGSVISYSPTPSSYVHIKYGSPTETPTGSRVKSLFSTLTPYHHKPKEQNHAHVVEAINEVKVSPEPFYVFPNSPSPGSGYTSSSTPSPKTFSYEPTTKKVNKVNYSSDLSYSPKPIYESTPKPLHDHSPKPIVNHSPKPFYESTPKPSYDYSPKPVFESTPKPSYDYSPKPIYESTPKPSYNYSPKPVYESSPKPSYDYSPKPVYESTPKPSYEYSPKPVYESSPKPSYDHTPKPIYESTPKPYYDYSPKPVYSSTPKPAYDYSPKPFYHSTPKPLHEYPSKPKSTSYYEHSVPKLIYQSNGLPKSPTRSPSYVRGLSDFFDQSDLSYNAPGYQGYSPTTDRSVVKSLQHRVTATPLPNYSPYHHKKHSEYKIGSPADEIPIHINHFPSPTPISPVSKLDFYTSPRPVYVPNGVVKSIHQDHLPNYSSTPYSEQPKHVSGLSGSTINELKNYLKMLSPDKGSLGLIEELLIKLSDKRDFKHESDKEIDIGSLQRKPNDNSPVSFSSTPSPFDNSPFKRHISSSESTTTTTTTTSRSPTTTTLTPKITTIRSSLPPQFQFAFKEPEDNMKPGSTLIKKPNGEIEFHSQEAKEDDAPIPFLEVNKLDSEIESQTKKDTFESFFNIVNNQKDEQPPSLILPNPAFSLSQVESIDDENEQTLLQLTSTLQSLTTTVKGLNTTIMEATQTMTPQMEVPMMMIKFMQKEIERLSETVEDLKRDQDSQMSKERVKNVLMEVVKEVEQVEKFKSDFVEQELEVLTEEISSNNFDHNPKSPTFDDTTVRPISLNDIITGPPTTSSISKTIGQDGNIGTNINWMAINNGSPHSEIKENQNLMFSTSPDSLTIPDKSSVETSVPSDVEFLNIPVGTSFAPKGNGFQGGSAGASLQVSDDPAVINVQSDGGVRKVTAVVGTSFSVDKNGNIIEESVKSPFLSLNNLPLGASTPDNKNILSSVDTSSATPEPLRHSFVSQGPSHLPLINPNGFGNGVQQSFVGQTSPRPNNFASPSNNPFIGHGTASPIPNTFVSPGQSNSPFLSHSTASPNTFAHGSSNLAAISQVHNNHLLRNLENQNQFALNQNNGSPFGNNQNNQFNRWQPNPSFNGGFSANNRPVRFPENRNDNLEDIIYDDYELTNEHSFYSSSRRELAHKPQYKEGVNVMADLASYSNRKNLLNGNGDRKYITKAKGNPSMEVIVYPSGQLLKGSDPHHPPSSTIGPNLETALLNSYYRNQLPHYVLAKNKRISNGDYDYDDYQEEKYDYEDEDKKKSKSKTNSKKGILQSLLDTARDDLKLVGNVIKLALS